MRQATPSLPIAVGESMRIKSRLFYWYAVFVIVSALTLLLPAPDHAALLKYHLHPLTLRLLDVTLLIPMYIMWFALFYGYAHLNRYGRLIGKNRDGRQVMKLADGLLALAIGMPIVSIISNIFMLITHAHPGFAPASAVISNYLNIVYPLIAFIFISKAARGLAGHSRTSPDFKSTNMVVAAVIVLGVIFCDLIARSHYSLNHTYHLSFTWAMFTIAIPYMYIWFLGLFAIAELYAYSKDLAGVLYRKGWNRLAFGFGAIVMLNILLQYLGTLATWLNGLSLAGFLLLLYVLLLLLASAFIVVALGTKDLMKIEQA